MQLVKLFVFKPQISLLQGLSLVLVKNPDEDDDEERMEEEADSVLKVFAGYEWLLQHLPALPLFDAVRVQACNTVRQVPHYPFFGGGEGCN